MDQVLGYIAISERSINREREKIKLLAEELQVSQRTVANYEERILELETIIMRLQAPEVSFFEVPKAKSGGVIKVILNTGRGFDFVAQGTLIAERMIACVHLPSTEPCPTPEIMLQTGNRNSKLDAAEKMCELWSTWFEHEAKRRKEEAENLRREQRTMKRHETYTKGTVREAFGSNDIPDDCALFHAAYGFMEGAQHQNHSSDVELKRCMKKERKNFLLQMVSHMYDGDIVRDIEGAVLKRKRFCYWKLARESDMYSTFNISAVGSIAKCEGGRKKGEMGLLCSESTLRRTLDLVHDQAQQLGFSSMPEEMGGKVWCWGDRNGSLVEGIHMYVKIMYHDTFCPNITAENPWIVPLTGDLARTSQRGAVVTVIGPKQSDGRLPNQEQTGKTMCQSSSMYTPAVAGYATEGELMPYFHAMVREFQKIETQGFCIVNGNECRVHIKVCVVADMSFLHKYVRRGGSSHSTTCFCMMCSAFCKLRHEGYPGGCRKCRAAGSQYGKDGMQVCLHHEVCTPEFLTWQTERYAQLCDLVPSLSLTSLPVWENVDQLRTECMKRCVGQHASQLPAISRKSGQGTWRGQALQDWILQYCRGGCTLSNDLETGVMHCAIVIVKQCLRERNIAVSDSDPHIYLRHQMQKILQLEVEFAKMTMYMRDKRFTDVEGNSIPLDRLILCTLHCPMRTHEKVLTLLMQECCMNRLANKSKPNLDAIAVILRRIGNLGDEWTYKMDEDNASRVEKTKMHWDQSKHIFKTEHLLQLNNIIRLAVPREKQANWILFMAQYVKCIELMTVSRDYTPADLVLLELYCDETYRLLITYCGGQAAVSNYFHYIGAGHIVFMCHAFGNIWRYRNEGVEAFNKILSKRYNMFNSAGNKGNLEKSKGGLQVLPFEVMGKWLGRYVTWQLDLANNLFLVHGGTLGPSEIVWDCTLGCFTANAEHIDSEEGYESDYSASSPCNSDSGDDLDEYTADDAYICQQDVHIEATTTSRKRACI